MIRPRYDGPVDKALALVRAMESEARATLAGLPHGVRHRAVILYAAAAAERLQRWHDGLPVNERVAYGATWRPVLDAIWMYATGENEAYYPIAHALGSFYLARRSGQDGPDDADRHEVAAVYYAANAVLHGCVDFALWAANRATDAIDNQWFDLDEGRLLDEITFEVERQRADLRRIADAAAGATSWANGAPPTLIEALREPH